MKYYVNRAWRGWSPGQPHPGFDEYDDGKPTGRVVGAGAVRQDQTAMPLASHSGLRRDLKLDAEIRRMVEKFEHGIRLTDSELSYLIWFYGVLVMAGDMLGQRYDLFTSNVTESHRRLIVLAAEREWHQSLINCYGAIARDVFQRVF